MRPPCPRTLALPFLPVALRPAPAAAAGASVLESSTVSAFQGSPLCACLTGGSGAPARKARGVNAVRQGPSAVPVAIVRGSWAAIEGWYR